jgi:hypothetical protein
MVHEVVPKVEKIDFLFREKSPFFPLKKGKSILKVWEHSLARLSWRFEWSVGNHEIQKWSMA